MIHFPTIGLTNVLCRGSYLSFPSIGDVIFYLQKKKNKKNTTQTTGQCHPGSGPPLHPGQRGSGHPAPSPESEDKATAAHPGGQRKQHHLCRASLLSPLLICGWCRWSCCKNDGQRGSGRCSSAPVAPGGPPGGWAIQSARPFSSPMFVRIQDR